MINLFKQNEGFSASTFTGLTEDDIPEEIVNDIIKVDEQTFKDLQDRKLMWNNGELVSNPDYETFEKKQELNNQKVEIKKQINHYKSLLSESDYRAIKYFEGYYTEEEYAPYKAQRQEYRDEINRLEEEMARL